MDAIRFDINSDGDFGYKVTFTTIIHDDRNVLIQKMIENLRELNESFHTSRTYVEKINNCLTRFLKAYDNQLPFYYDQIYEDVWFVRNKDEFDFCFSLDNGNQQIEVYETTIEINKIDGGYMIKE